MAPVFELFPLGVEELVGLAVVVIVVGVAVDLEAALEEVLEEPMSVPGGTSGESTEYRFRAVHERRSG
jgi:hypothetical protein